MMDGEEGLAVRKSMELLVALGNVFGAEKLVPVESAHISGVSYKNLGSKPRPIAIPSQIAVHLAQNGI